MQDLDFTSAYYVLTAVFGILAGAVVNWLADDLPHTYRLREPHYPDGTPRPLIAWIGILAFVTGKRRSSGQGTSAVAAPEEPAESDQLAEAGELQTTQAIDPPGGAARTLLSWRHPLTEIVMAVLFFFAARDFGASARALLVMGNIAILVLITVIDLEHRMILFVVIYPACLYALVGNALLGPALAPRVYSDFLIGGAVGFAVFSVMYLGGLAFSTAMARARGEPLDEVAFGSGDVLLATLAGFILGWQHLIFAILIAVFAGGAGALLYMASRALIRRQYEMFTALPYGQYIVFGTLVMMLGGREIVQALYRIA